MYKFCNAVVELFGKVYLREPNMADTARLVSINESRGFRVMLGSIDCIYWKWKNCPFAWRGQYNVHAEGCTIILEAVASNLVVFFFGIVGSNKDINMLRGSPLLARFAEGNAPEVNCEINGHQCEKEYSLVDGIYPEWSTFVKTICDPSEKKYRSLRKNKRHIGRMWSRYLVCSHLVELLFGTLLEHITMRPCER
jgi:hypothetical protein